MSTETTNKKIKIDNGTTFGRTYTDKAIDAKLPTDLIATANKLSLGVGNTALGNGVNLNGFTYDEATKTLKASGGAALSVQTISPSRANIIAPSGSYKAGDNKVLFTPFYSTEGYDGETIIIEPSFISYAKNGALILFYQQEIDINRFRLWFNLVFTKDTTLSSPIELLARINRYYIPRA